MKSFEPGSRWFYFSVGAAAILSLVSLTFRYRVEARNRAAAICMEVSAISSLGAQRGYDLRESMRRLRESGLSAVAVSETTIADLLSEGEARLARGALVADDPDVLAACLEAMKLRFPQAQTASIEPAGRGSSMIRLGAISPDALATTSLGISPEICAAARDARLEIICRHRNTVGLTPAVIQTLIRSSHALGARYFLAEGDSVFGHREATATTIDAIRELGMYYCAAEFAKIAGDAGLAERLSDRVINLHSAQAAEIDRMSPAEATERYLKAYRERDVRVLLLRPITWSSEDSFAANSQLIAKLADGIRRAGGDSRAPHPFADPGVPPILFLGIALAVVPALWGIASSLFGNRRSLAMAACVALSVLAIACWLHQGRQLFALACATAFPIGAYVVLARQEAVKPLREYVVLSVICLAGGLCVAGQLNEQQYFTRVDQFLGVKLAHFLPIFVAAWLMLKSVGDVRDTLSRPVVWGGALISLIVLSALALMWMRTGNDNPAAVSGFELRLRGVIDALLYTRPRSKEFLLGHPALWVGLWMLSRTPARQAYRHWGALLVTVGAIGQTSIVNTMCHLHTPLDIGLARIVIGLVCGCIIGVLLVSMLHRYWNPGGTQGT